MKAIKCTGYGSPNVLKIVEIKKPSPKKNEVLVKNLVTTVTVGDCRIRGFNVPAHFWLAARLMLGIFKPRKSILGVELAGTIEEAGRNARKFKAGDEVFAFTSRGFGANAEYVCVDESKCIAQKPKNLSFEQSAALSFGGITALHFLKRGEIKAGEKILVYGASGSVGSSAVQLAKYLGAEVTGVCSGKNMELVAGLGADNVIDYTKADLADINEEYDLFFDTVGKADIQKSIRLIKPNGRYLHAVTDPFTVKKIESLLTGTGIKLIGGTYRASAEQINEIGRLAAEGAIKPVIDRTFNFNEIASAHEYVDKGHKVGNVVIKFS